MFVRGLLLVTNPIHLRELPNNLQSHLTAGELMQLLARVPPETIVLIECYESGVTSGYRVSQSEVIKDESHSPVCGEYCESTIDDDGERYPYYLCGLPTQKAIVLSYRCPTSSCW